MKTDTPLAAILFGVLAWTTLLLAGVQMLLSVRKTMMLPEPENTPEGRVRRSGDGTAGNNVLEFRRHS